MQRFVNLCEYLHTFGSGCNVSFARDSVYWSGRTGDGATVVGQYKYPRRIPRGEVVLRVIRFSKGRGATVFSRRGITSRRGSRGARTCRLERHLHRYIVPCRLFSGEDAEKSSTTTDQGGDHRVRNSECFSCMPDPPQTPSPGPASASGAACNSLWSHRLQAISVAVSSPPNA